MIKKVAQKITSFLVTHGLPSDKEKIYNYGAECLLNLIITYSILLIISSFLKCTSEMLVWIFSFSLLRNHLGGYHANSHWKCILSTIIICICGIYTKNLWLVNRFTKLFAIIVLLASLFIVIKIAPVLHPNHPLSYNQRDKERKISIIIITLEIIICIVTYFILSNISVTILTAITFAVILAIIGYYFN